MQYNLYSGVQETASKLKRKISIGLATVFVAGAGMTGAAFAANDYCGASSNGCEHAAAAGAQCGTGAGSGAFGYFGKDNNLAGGADGRQTGINNSALCGNRPAESF